MSFRPPDQFAGDPNALEDVERATMRFVCQGVSQILEVATGQFAEIPLGSNVKDNANYLGEDLTRLALDRIGAPRVPDGRLFGAVDFKLAAYQFLPEFAVRQALLVDSKAEKNALNNARVQVTQTSLEIRQVRGAQPIAIQGLIPPVWAASGVDYLTTTILVKYHYREAGGSLGLRRVTIAALPSGFLQAVYNPSAAEGIWNVGPDAPTLGEKFRTRLNFTLLEQKASWRVQRMTPGEDWQFRE
ncbi:MAG TPA: SfiI family type II restriction endonuclease [Gaiellaceae bacterium]